MIVSNARRYTALAQRGEAEQLRRTACHARWKAVQKQAAQGTTAMQQDACSACMGAGYHAATCSDQQGSHRMGTQQLSAGPVWPVTSQDGPHKRRWRCGNAASYQVKQPCRDSNINLKRFLVQRWLADSGGFGRATSQNNCHCLPLPVKFHGLSRPFEGKEGRTTTAMPLQPGKGLRVMYCTVTCSIHSMPDPALQDASWSFAHACLSFGHSGMSLRGEPCLTRLRLNHRRLR